eukprot:gene4807-6118_t
MAASHRKATVQFPLVLGSPEQFSELKEKILTSFLATYSNPTSRRSSAVPVSTVGTMWSNTFTGRMDQRAYLQRTSGDSISVSSAPEPTPTKRNRRVTYADSSLGNDDSDSDHTSDHLRNAGGTSFSTGGDR